MEDRPVACGRGLAKYFDDVVALEDVDISIDPGELRGLIGPNGAGKTTVMGILLGLTRPDAGVLTVLGQALPASGPIRTFDGVSGFVDSPMLYPDLSARRNLRLLAALHLNADRREIDSALHRVGLGTVAAERVGGFSLGMRQRLGLAAAMLGRPRLLVLDEPTNGLDPAGRSDVHQILRDLAAEGVAVLLSSHHMDDVEALCDSVTVLNTGRVAYDGTVSRLRGRAPAPMYRLVTSDARSALALARRQPAIEVCAGEATEPGSALTVRGEQDALDRLVAELVRDGTAIRELRQLRSPLEAAFMELTGQPESSVPDQARDQASGQVAAGAVA